MTAGHEAALALTAGFPEHMVAEGASITEFGDASQDLLVLVEGSLSVEVQGVRVTTISEPGSFVGEISALLGIPRTATVRALVPSRVRVVDDPKRFLAQRPDVALELARTLARRLHVVTSYLADVKRQYAGRNDHLGMLDDVLASLITQPAVEIDPGSEREPDYL